MPLTASDVIDQARGLDSAFVRERNPDKVLLPFLERLNRRLVGELLDEDPRAITTEIEISLPLSTFEDGAQLVDGAGDPLEWQRIHTPADVVRDSDDEKKELRIIDFGNRHDHPEWPSIWIQNGYVFLTGEEDDWEEYSKIILTVTETPSAVDSTADTLDLDSEAEDAVVSHLGAFMARRTPQEQLTRPRQEYIDEAAVAEQLYLERAYRREGARVSKVRSVW